MSEIDRLRQNVFDNLQEIERLKNIINEAINYTHVNHKHFGIDEKDYIDVTGIFEILDKVNK